MVWITNLGLLLVMAATAMPLFHVEGAVVKWVYVAGAVLSLVGSVVTRCPGTSLRVRRLHRMGVFSALFFCAGAFFMFYQKYGVGPTDWIGFTLAGAVLRIYTALMMPRALRSE